MYAAIVREFQAYLSDRPNVVCCKRLVLRYGLDEIGTGRQPIMFQSCGLDYNYATVGLR